MYVTTFYSFKGGGGRTMALVNVAVELAQRGRGVLAVDFDLEAPGLDTFNILRSRKRRPGIVDFVTEYLDTGRAPEAERFIHDSKDAGENGGCLWVMPSGEQDEKYATSFREIDWLDLYERHDGYLLFEDLKAQWEQFVKPDYVLIDSRTGHTDTGGICTRQLPDAVAILFFPNDQNLRGQNAIVFRNSPTRAESPQVHWGIIGSIAVPVILHMIQRERKDEVEFPSLMFLRKVPYRSFRRQRVRHWFLLLLRCAALLLLLFAFARPFIRAAALAAMTDGAREVVVLLDRSYSMSFGGRWDEAQTLATDTIAALDSGDRATVILFDGGAETGPRSTTDRASLRGLVENAEVGSGVTRYGPALKLAEGIFESSDLPRLEAVLISDFQRAGVESAVGVRFPQGTVLTPIPVGEDDATGANVSVAGVLFEREYFSGRERIQVAARLTNRGPTTAITGLDVALDMEGREVETLTADLAPAGSTTVDFAPVTLADAQMFGAVRIAPDALPADDVFHFIVSPGQVVTVLVVGSASAPDDANLFLNARARHRVRAGVRRARDDAGELLGGGPRGPAGGGAERHAAAGGCCGRWPARPWPRSSRRGADCSSWRGNGPRGRRTIRACCPAAWRRRRTATAAADRSASSTTAIRCSRCSARRAAATSRPPASSASGRWRRRQTRWWWRASTTATRP